MSGCKWGSKMLGKAEDECSVVQRRLLPSKLDLFENVSGCKCGITKLGKAQEKCTVVQGRLLRSKLELLEVGKRVSAKVAMRSWAGLKRSVPWSNIVYNGVTERDGSGGTGGVRGRGIQSVRWR